MNGKNRSGRVWINRSYHCLSDFRREEDDLDTVRRLGVENVFVDADEIVRVVFLNIVFAIRQGPGKT